MKLKKIVFILVILFSSQTHAVEAFSSTLNKVATTWYQDGVIVLTNDIFTVSQGTLTCSGKMLMLNDNLMLK